MASVAVGWLREWEKESAEKSQHMPKVCRRARGCQLIALLSAALWPPSRTGDPQSHQELRAVSGRIIESYMARLMLMYTLLQVPMDHPASAVALQNVGDKVGDSTILNMHVGHATANAPPLTSIDLAVSDETAQSIL